MLIKIFAGIFFIFLCQKITSQEIWQKQISPVNAWLHKCCYTDSLNVWAAGDSGIVINTSNGGVSWNRQNTGISFFIEDITFINNNSGWAVANNYVGLGAVILSTTNGGLNWSHLNYPDSSVVFFSIFFLDPLNGWISGYNGLFLNTTNGGLSWTVKPTDSSFASQMPVRSLLFKNSATGFGCGGFRDIASVIWRTTNSGNNWISSVSGGEPLYDLTSVDPLNIIAVGGDPEFGATIVKTTDGGNNWSADYLNFFGAGYSIAFRTPQEAWIALGFSQQFIYSLDSAVTWNKSAIFDSSCVYSVIFPDPFHGYAVGTNGLILKYNPKAIGVIQNQHTAPSSFSLLQNFPNPFNGTTIIEFYLPKRSPVDIKIFDISGREVRVLQKVILSAGWHKIRMDMEELASGIYFYRIAAGDFSESRKMVLLK